MFDAGWNASNKKRDEMNEIKDFEVFHPRAVKLMRKHKFFIVIANDEPYFLRAYRLIREHESPQGTWTTNDEIIYQECEKISKESEESDT